jgi:hypothetical protein
MYILSLNIILDSAHSFLCPTWVPSRRSPLVLGLIPIDLSPPPLPLVVLRCFLSSLDFVRISLISCSRTSAGIPAHRTSPDALRASSGNLWILFDSLRKLGARTRVRGAAHELKPSPLDLTLEHVLNTTYVSSHPASPARCAVCYFSYYSHHRWCYYMFSHSPQHLLSYYREHWT